MFLDLFEVFKDFLGSLNLDPLVVPEVFVVLIHKDV